MASPQLSHLLNLTELNRNIQIARNSSIPIDGLETAINAMNASMVNQGNKEIVEKIVELFKTTLMNLEIPKVIENDHNIETDLINLQTKLEKLNDFESINEVAYEMKTVISAFLKAKKALEGVPMTPQTAKYDAKVYPSSPTKNYSNNKS